MTTPLRGEYGLTEQMQAKHVLLTGASSFTGSWFAAHLAERGHVVAAPFARDKDDYVGERNARVSVVAAVADVAYAAPMGSPKLRSFVSAQDHLDVICIHHAVVGDYRSPSFDVASAVRDSTSEANELAAAAATRGATRMILTRSIFEAGLGLSDDPRPIGLYAVAKSAASHVWAEAARRAGLSVSNFTIANPFGPREEPRLVNHLVQTWAAGGIAQLRAPHWVRDNVPVPLLADAYTHLVSSDTAPPTTPSHLVATNLDFARRIALEFGARWDRTLPVGEAPERETGEPRLRVGTDFVDFSSAERSSAFWDGYAEYYYSSRLGPRARKDGS